MPYSGTVIGPGDLEQLVDRVGGDPEHAVDLRVAGLVRVQADGVLGARREVGRPVRVGQLPGLLRAEQVVGQLRRRLDERVVPGQVEQEDVLERPLGDLALVEGDDPVAPGVAAGRPELGRVLGQDQVAPRAVPAQHRRQSLAEREVRVEQRAVLVDPLDHRVAGALERGGQPVRARSPAASRACAREACAARASSRDVAISSTSWASAEAEPGSAAWASLISTNRSPMASPWSAASNRSRAAATTVSAPCTSACACGTERASADERVVREQVGQAVEPRPGGGQVAAAGRRWSAGRCPARRPGPASPSPRGRSGACARRPRRAGSGRRASPAAGGHEEQERQPGRIRRRDGTCGGDAAVAVAVRAAAAAGARSARAACAARASGWSPGVGHGAGWAMTTKRGAVSSGAGRRLEGQLLGRRRVQVLDRVPGDLRAGPGRRRTSGSSHPPGSGRPGRPPWRPTATGTSPSWHGRRCRCSFRRRASRCPGSARPWSAAHRCRRPRRSAGRSPAARSGSASPGSPGRRSRRGSKLGFRPGSASCWRRRPDWGWPSPGWRFRRSGSGRA